MVILRHCLELWSMASLIGNMSDTAYAIHRLALSTIGVGILVLVLKLVAWWQTGSVAVLSDALETVVNIAAAIVALWAVRLANTPADANHPHGHGKAEYLSAALEGALVLVAAFVIFSEAFQSLLAPKPVIADPLGLTVLALATGINAVWARILLRQGTAHRSAALTADGKHLSVDVMTSVTVFIGVGLTLWSGIWWLDPLIAFLLGLLVLWTGWKVIREGIGPLMDETISDEDLARIETTISANLGAALEAHDVKVRTLGRKLAVDMHLIVPAEMTVADAHGLCDEIECALAPLTYGGPVMIHVEPPPQAKGGGSMLFDRA